MTAPAQPDLPRLRRQTGTKAVHLLAALIARPPTPWDRRPITDQLRALGFHAIYSPQQSQHELQGLDGFLTLWLDLLPITDGIEWHLWTDDDDHGQHP